MASSIDEESRPPYASFQALNRAQKGIGMVGAIIAVVAFGFVSVSIRMEGGGSGWPLHDVLHPLLGLLMGPVYGPISSLVGAAMSEVITPYTALDGLSPVLGGVSALTSGLLVQGRRGERILWAIASGLVGALFVFDAVDGGSWTLSGRYYVLSVVAALLFMATPPVCAWMRRHLRPSGWSWNTAGALYALCFIGSAFGLLAFWTVRGAIGWESVGGGATGVGMRSLERVFLPLVGALLGTALWPALQRRLFSVANQLRYGLPLFILITFFFAGRLSMDRAYDATQGQTEEQIVEQGKVAARALATEFERAERLLHRRLDRNETSRNSPFFRWIEHVSANSSAPPELPSRIRSLVTHVRRTDQAQHALVSLPDTSIHSVVVGVPARTGRTSAFPEPEVVVGCVAPTVIERTLRAWNETEGHFYLINQVGEPILERPHSEASENRQSLTQAALRANDGAVQASRGRYGDDVLGAVAALEDVSASVVVEQKRSEAYLHVFDMLLSMAFILLVTGGGALAVGFYVSKRVVTPLDRLIQAARRVGDGDLSTRVSVEQKNELGELADSFNAMTQELASSIKRLRANEERLRMALDAAQMGTWNWSAESDRVTWSPQTYSLLRVPQHRDEHLFEAFLARVHPEDRERVANQIQNVFGSETSFTIEHRVRPRGNTDRWVRLQGQVFRKNGEPLRVSGIIMDITARKEAEQELMAAKEEAEEMSRLKSAFLANVSHEIRTPLTSIIGFAEILAEEVPMGQKDQAEKVVNSARRLMETLDSVLDLSMIEAGEFTLDCRPFDVAEEVRQRAELLRPMAERKNLQFRVGVPDDRTEVTLDSNCLDRILTNLVTNAIKFTEEGRVSVEVRQTPRNVILRVCDTGIGIDDEFLPDLFEAFKQESEGLRREHDGTGLGLSITKELVQLMDGEIDVDSQKGVGTTITVRLPYRISEDKESVV